MEKKSLKTILKTTQNSFFLSSKNPRVFMGKKGYQGQHTERRIKSWRAAPHKSHENAAMAVFLRP